MNPKLASAVVGALLAAGATGALVRGAVGPKTVSTVVQVCLPEGGLPPGVTIHSHDGGHTD
jgi:hypothetical protein